MDKISVIICCYNTANTLDRCFDSLKRQTYGLKNLECVFVDDGSSDDGATWAKLTEYEKEYPNNVLLVRCKENGRLGTASNIGLSYATGKYLQFLDADDELAPNALEELYRLSENMQTDIIQYCHTLIMGEKRQVNLPQKTGLFEINNIEQRNPFLNSTLVTYGRTNKFYRLEFVKEVNSHFAEHLVYEEPLFVYPLFLYAKRIYITDESYYLYYLHEDSIVTGSCGLRLLDHPNVQMQLLYDCMKRKDIYLMYKDVIMLYFLWTYYCETLIFAKEYENAKLPLEFFTEMQNNCRTLFPDWKNNAKIKNVEEKVWNILLSIDRKFSSQKDLDKFIDNIKI